MSGADTVLASALCWRIERRDGVMLALTDHDRDLTVDGIRHRAAPGMTPSAIVRAEGLDADTMEARGALDAAAMTADDLRAGRWDGARLAMFAIDWSDPAAEAVPLGEGVIGEIELRDGGFAAELRGPAAALDRPVAAATSAGCRAALGDARCGVAMAGRRHIVRVLAADDATLTVDRGEPATNAFGEGMLRWLGGANTGLGDAIATSDGARVTLRSAPRFAVVAGTRAEITEGCDKRLATCAARFGNAVNFRGEPFLPGMDLLTRYVGG
jgi:uncharacterized phage protein (TIGR02218 family)